MFCFLPFVNKIPVNAISSVIINVGSMFLKRLKIFLVHHERLVLFLSNINTHKTLAQEKKLKDDNIY